MVKRLVLLAALAAVAGGGLLWWRHASAPKPLPPERELFARAIPLWSLAKYKNDLPNIALERATDLARPFPKLEAALRAVDAAWPAGDKVKAAVAGLNGEAQAAGLAYWIDVQILRGQPLLMGYSVEGRARWKQGEREVEVLRVRRLDNLNIELGLTGHAGGDRPVVLLDRIEPLIMEEAQAAFAEEPEGNDVDRAARAAWRERVGRQAGAEALAEGARLLARRREAFDRMNRRMQGSTIDFLEPQRFDFGEDYFERLAEYTDPRRRGGALILAADLRDLRRADRALADGEGRAALEVALDLEAHAVEAHEARHALEPEKWVVPPDLLDAVGDDDMPFAESAERELRAYVGELHDAQVPPCLVLARIAVHVRGKHARATPHFYAGWTLLKELFGEAPEEENTPAALERLCKLPDPELRALAAKAQEAIYARPFVPATRLATPPPGAATSSR